MFSLLDAVSDATHRYILDETARRLLFHVHVYVIIVGSFTMISNQCPYKNGSPRPRSRSRSTSRSRPSSKDRSTAKKDWQSGQAECHLAQPYEYEMPSDTSHINSEVASSYPTYIMDSDIHDHCDDNDYNHYSTEIWKLKWDEFFSLKSNFNDPKC